MCQIWQSPTSMKLVKPQPNTGLRFTIVVNLQAHFGSRLPLLATTDIFVTKYS